MTGTDLIFFNPNPMLGLKPQYIFIVPSIRSEGLINVKTRWKEYSKFVVESDEYKAVEKGGGGGSRPKELFEYLIEDMETEYETAKGWIKDIIKAGDGAVLVTPDTTYAEFAAKLKEVDDAVHGDREDGEAEPPSKEESNLAKISEEYK